MGGSPLPSNALQTEAQGLARILERSGARLVLAESCTGGLASAALTQVPGVSKHFCGSAVVYQSETKSDWLKIPKSLLQKHGTESLEASRALAGRILDQTPQATISGAITGDLGPLSSDPKKVGVIFVACAIKTRGTIRFPVSQQIRLPKRRAQSAKELRILLQHAASKALLRMVRQVLSDTLRQPRGN